MRGAALLFSLWALAACTPPAPQQDKTTAPAPGLSLSGYATVGVAKTF